MTRPWKRKARQATQHFKFTHMKLLHFLALMAATAAAVTVQAQLYYTTSGHIRFYSDAPLEDIEAHNRAVSSFIDLRSGKVVAKVPIRKFDFPNDLMEEHFNERYMHSDQYPNAQLRGKIVNLSEIDLESTEPQKVIIEGDLTIHGITKKYRIEGTLQKKGEGYRAKAQFKVRVKDHGITIPKLMAQKIAEVVDVFVDFDYQPYKKRK